MIPILANPQIARMVRYLPRRGTPTAPPRLAANHDPRPDPAPLSPEDRAYLDYQFVRDWIVSNPEVLQSETGAAMLRTLYPNRF